jgi:hypothetical protein
MDSEVFRYLLHGLLPEGRHSSTPGAACQPCTNESASPGRKELQGPHSSSTGATSARTHR